MSHLGDVGQVHQPHCPQMNCQSKVEKHIRPLSEKWGKNGGKGNLDILPEESRQKYIWKKIMEEKGNYVSWHV